MDVDKAFVFDGKNAVWVQDLKVDSQGNKYLSAGHSGAITFPQLGRTLYDKGTSFFLLKVDQNNEYAWVKSFHGEKSCYIQQTAVGKDGVLAVTGFYSGTYIKVDGVRYSGLENADADRYYNPVSAFVCLLSPEGTVLWCKNYSAIYASGMAVGIDHQQNVYAWLSFNESIKGRDFELQRLQHSSEGERQSTEVLLKYDKEGTLMAKKIYDDPENAFFRGKPCYLLFDEEGDVYASYSWRGAFNFGTERLQNDRLKQDYDQFIARLDAETLDPKWIVEIGGHGGEDISSLTWTPDGRLLVAGRYRYECSLRLGDIFPIQSSEFEYKSGTSSFLCKVSKEGAISDLKFQEGEGYNGYFTQGAACIDGRGIAHTFGSYIGQSIIRNPDGTEQRFGTKDGREDSSYYAQWRGDTLVQIASLGNMIPYGGFTHTAYGKGWLWVAGVSSLEEEITLRNGERFTITHKDVGVSAFLFGTRLDWREDTSVKELASTDDIPYEGSAQWAVEQVLAAAAAATESETEFQEEVQEITEVEETDAEEEKSANKEKVSSANEPWSASLYPNPTSSVLHVRIEKTDHAQLVFTDLNGRMLLAHQLAFKGESQTLQFDMSQLATGTYLLVVISQDTQKVMRFVKQ